MTTESTDIAEVEDRDYLKPSNRGWGGKRKGAGGPITTGAKLEPRLVEARRILASLRLGKLLGLDKLGKAYPDLMEKAISVAMGNATVERWDVRSGQIYEIKPPPDSKVLMGLLELLPELVKDEPEGDASPIKTLIGNLNIRVENLQIVEKQQINVRPNT